MTCEVGVVVYLPGGGGIWAPVFTTKERAEEYVRTSGATMPLGSSRKPVQEFK